MLNCREILYNSLNEKCGIFNTLTNREKSYILWKMNGNYYVIILKMHGK